MGFVEETGAAQYYRDARILPIYEGTNGIQAIDLVTRKLPLEGGAVITSYIGDLREMAEEVRASNLPAFGKTADKLDAAIDALETASVWLGKTLASEPNKALSGATPYLRLFGLAAGGCYLGRAAVKANRDGERAETQTALARFFAENLAVACGGLAENVLHGADSVMALTPEALSV